MLYFFDQHVLVTLLFVCISLSRLFVHVFVSQEQEKKRKQKEEAKKKLEAEKVRSFVIHVRDDKHIFSQVGH